MIFPGLLAHQHLVAADVRFTLGAIENQGVCLPLVSAADLDRRWETPRRPGRRCRSVAKLLLDQLADRRASQSDIGVKVHPLIAPVRIDDQAQPVLAGWVRDGMVFHSRHDAGSRRVDEASPRSRSLKQPRHAVPFRTFLARLTELRWAPRCRHAAAAKAGTGVAGYGRARSSGTSQETFLLCRSRRPPWKVMTCAATGQSCAFLSEV